MAGPERALGPGAGRAAGCQRARHDQITVAGSIAPGFGAINLGDIAAPRCFEVEQRLREVLDIPVFHDDQHGTAVVVAAALLNATRVVRKPLENMTAVIGGVGAAGSACAKLLIELGIGDLVAIDRTGILAPEQMGLNTVQLKQSTSRNGAPDLAHPDSLSRDPASEAVAAQ